MPRVAVVGCGDVSIVHFEARPKMEPRPTISHGPGGVDGRAAGRCDDQPGHPTLDLLQWFLGEVTQFQGGVCQRLLGGGIEVEDTVDLVLDHSSGARSVLFATAANVVDSPVTLEVVTEEATLYVRGDQTITYADGRVETVHERVAGSGGRAYWGVSHQCRDFYDRLAEDEPFWISPAEAAKSLRIIGELHARSGFSVPGGSAESSTGGKRGIRLLPE